MASAIIALLPDPAGPRISNRCFSISAAMSLCRSDLRPTNGKARVLSTMRLSLSCCLKSCPRFNMSPELCSLPGVIGRFARRYANSTAMSFFRIPQGVQRYNQRRAGLPNWDNSGPASLFGAREQRIAIDFLPPKRLLTVWLVCERIKTVSKPHLFDPLRLSAERKQTPQIVEKPRNRKEAKDAVEAIHAPPEQKVRGSNPLGRTTFFFRDFQAGRQAIGLWSNSAPGW
jgi:hypothetical protein